MSRDTATTTNQRNDNSPRRPKGQPRAWVVRRRVPRRVKASNARASVQQQNRQTNKQNTIGEMSHIIEL